MLEIRINTLADREWDDFVHRQDRAVWAHQAAWRSVIERAYRCPSYYFQAWDGNATVGVLPTVHVSSRLFGNHLVSMPYLDDGGVLAADGAAEQAILDAAAEHARMLGARCDFRAPFPLETDWTVNTNKVTLQLEIGADVEAVWRSLPSTRRNRVRKAQENGLAASFHGKEKLSAFYDVFCRNMRDLGSPVHSDRFFDAVLGSFPERTGIILVRDKTDRPVGAGLYVRFRDTMALPWVSCRRDAFHLYPNMLLYWELIQKACREGALRFDFGRSSIDSGTYEFKRQWGAKPSQLYWYSRSANGETDPSAIDTQSPRRRALIRLWKHMPLPLSRRLGPWLRRSLPL
jgi:serine/alanine adding enzyme